MLIDKYAYSNKFLNIHPFEKFLITALTLFLLLVLNSPMVSIFVLIINSGILIYKAGIDQGFYLKLMLLPFSFLLMGTLSIAFNLISPHEKALLSFSILSFNIGITKISFIQAYSLFLKALSSVSCLYFLALTTPLIDIISVLKKFRLPELFLELMGLIYRFIFILSNTAGAIYNSQDSRLGYFGIKNSFRSMGYLVSNLFIRAFNKSNQLFIALESRGYTGSINVLENEYKYNYKNIIIIIFIESLILAIYLMLKK